ncbi:MAG: hypothetical protein KF767_19225, partial [Bdellovibrionaceae bacterium]|nr:hypothetical protein [Pseudobdellovibrionaceae bacterium]
LQENSTIQENFLNKCHFPVKENNKMKESRILFGFSGPDLSCEPTAAFICYERPCLCRFGRHSPAWLLGFLSPVALARLELPRFARAAPTGRGGV